MKQFIKRIPWLQIGKAFLCSAGAIETIVFVCVWLNIPTPDWFHVQQPNGLSHYRLLSVLCVTLLWFFIDGFFVTGYLKQTIVLPICNGSASLTIEFGDLFKKEGLKVIPVNSFFDSIVNESVVAAATLHGIMLSRFFAGCTNEFDRQISQSLSQQGINPIDHQDRLDGVGKTAEYQIGTAAIAKTAKGNSFLCVALANTNPQTNQASASITNVYESVRGALEVARSYGNGHPVVFPLLGDGLSRTGFSPVVLLNLMILAIIAENQKQKVSNDIRIVLHSSKKGMICLPNIQKAWEW